MVNVLWVVLPVTNVHSLFLEIIYVGKESVPLDPR